MSTAPRYKFLDGISKYPHVYGVSYGVSARTDRGWDITWYVERTEDGGWSIWRSTPSNEPLYIKTTGSLGRRILSRVWAEIAQESGQLDTQAVGGVQ